ncbi:MAG: hypothetical protein CMN77_12000 [Spirochaetaceae bacterium]|nr:hypothetical protein [Spirochaetaceae bacterium]|tara:strand:+ start:23058 stop:23939 length:882 start_codon:yes stop_codon:yes gene_type:complete
MARKKVVRAASSQKQPEGIGAPGEAGQASTVREKNPAYVGPAMDKHIQELLACRKCPNMQGHPVHGCVHKSSILSLGQAPGIHEERFGKPFAYTAGKTLFKWLASIGVEEEDFRRKVNMSAVCRCFPGKAKNGDRKPSRTEVDHCLPHLGFEIRYHKPGLIIPIGKLAIDQLLERSDWTELKSDGSGDTASKKRTIGSRSHWDGLSHQESPGPMYLNSKGRANYKLHQVIGYTFRSSWYGTEFDWIALPHPSGLNVWNHTEMGKRCIAESLTLLASHKNMRASFGRSLALKSI